MMSASQFNIAEREFGFGFGSGFQPHNIQSEPSLTDLGTSSYSNSYSNSYNNSNSYNTERLDHTNSTISTLTTNAMDFVAANKEECDIRQRRVLQETKFFRKFAKILGVACVLLVVCVFGVDVHLLEEVATVLVHNVVAAIILILGLNVSALVYDAMATPVPGSPVSPSTPLQGLVRRPSQNCLMPFHHLSSRRRRPAEITLRATSSSPRKRSSGGGLFGGLWPRKRSPKNKGEPREAKRRGSADRIKEKFSRKLPIGGRRRGWPSGGRSTAGSI